MEDDYAVEEAFQADGRRCSVCVRRSFPNPGQEIFLLEVWQFSPDLDAAPIWAAANRAIETLRRRAAQP